MTTQSLRAKAANQAADAVNAMLASDMAQVGHGAPSGVAGNIANAILSTYAAHGHLMLPAAPNDALKRSVEEWGIEPQDMQRLCRPDPNGKCGFYPASTTNASYMCAYEGAHDGRAHPCPQCPKIISTLPEIAQPLLDISPQAPEHRHNQQNALLGMAQTLEILGQMKEIAETLERCAAGEQPDTRFASAAIMLMNGAYMLGAAAQSYHGNTANQQTHAALQQTEPVEHEIAGLLYKALGSQAEFLPPNDHIDQCMQAHKGEDATRYLCYGPNGVYAKGQSRFDDPVEKCPGCPFHNTAPPQGFEQLVAAVSAP